MSLVAGALAQEKTVTYASLGGPAKRVLADLSNQAGIKLTTNVQTESDYLFVNVTDVPLPKLLEKIAWTLAASWKKDGDAYMLVRTDSDRAAAEKAARAREMGAFAAGIRLRNEKMAKQGAFTEAKAEELARSMSNLVKGATANNRDGTYFNSMAKLTKQAPASRALSRLISQFTAAELTDLPDNFQVVYSTKPTAMERSLGGAGTSALNAFNRENALWFDAARRTNLQPFRDGDVIYNDSSIPNPNEESTASRLVLVVSKIASVRGVIEFRLLVVDAAGKVVGQSTEILASEDVDSFEEESKTTGGEAVIDLSADDRQFQEFDANGKVDPAFLQKLLDPVNHDPLSIAAAPVFREYAKVAKQDVVANLADMELTVGSMAGRNKLPARLFAKVQRLFCEEQREGSWVTWRPGDFMKSRAETANRKYLGEFLRRHTQPNGLTFEEKAYWAFRLPSKDRTFQMANSLAQMVRRAVSGTQDSDYYDPRFLKLYGSLTTEQRNALRKGGLPASMLNDEQSQGLLELAYGVGARLELSEEPGKHMLRYSEVAVLPTEALPNGIPAQTTITLIDQSQEVIFVKSTENGGRATFQTQMAYNAETAAWERFSATRPDLYPWVRQMGTKDFEKVLYGKEVTFTFKIQFTPTVSQSFQAKERAFSSLTPIAFNQLPATFLEKYQQSYKMHEETAKYEQAARAAGGSGNPPPPLR